MDRENDRIQMEFLEVCSFGALEQAKTMLNDGKIDKNFHHHGNGWTALHWAARRNHQEIVELLLQANFDPKSPAKDGKTPMDLATNETVKELLVNSVKPITVNKTSESTSTSRIATAEEKKPLKENGFGRRYGRENGQFRKNKNSLTKTKQLAKSFDSGVAPGVSSVFYRAGDVRAAPKHEIYAYGRDSLNRTRFLLVRTRYHADESHPYLAFIQSTSLSVIDQGRNTNVKLHIGNGKESFKRVTFPGHGSIETLKTVIERAMRRGKVVELYTLPDRMRIETEQQVQDLANCQKLDVTFDAAEEINYDRKFSLDEAEIARSKHAPVLEKKAASIISEYLNEPAAPRGDRLADDIISLSDDSNSATLDDSFGRMDGIEEPSQSTELPEIVLTSECLLAAEKSASAADITLPSKAVTVEETVAFKAAAPQKNADEMVLDTESESIPMPAPAEQPKVKETDRDQLQVVQGNYVLANNEPEILTIPAVLQIISINGNVACDNTKPVDISAAVSIQRDGDVLLEKKLDKNFNKISRKRVFKVALFVGGIVGIGGLAYMIYKK